MTQMITRASRYKRRVTEKSLCFTERDFTLLHALYKYQLLTTHQLVNVHQGSEHKTRLRLRELFDAGLLERFHTKTDMTIPGSEPIVYALTDLGADWLSEHRDDIDRQRTRYNENNARRKITSIPHALMVADIMLAFELACYYGPERAAFVAQQHMISHAPEQTRNRRTPTHWSNKVVVNGDPHTIGNNPDQMFGIVDKERPEGRNTLFFFLEADRATETVQPVTKHLNKATIYKKLLGYYHTHAQKVLPGVFGEWLRNFRVLWVIDSQAKAAGGKTRLENFLDTTRSVTDGRIADLFLYTTHEALKAHGNPLTHTWVNANGEERKII